MFFESSGDVFLESTVIGAVTGLLFGMIALLLGSIRSRVRDGAMGCLLCVIFGALGGWVVAVLVAIVATITIGRVPSDQHERVSCPYCA